MSYFLEPYEDKICNTSNILEDYTGMNEILFNAEIAWGNIMESTMINEYKAIKNEDDSSLEDNKEGFFAKAKKWFKDLFKSIGRVIINIKNNIVLKFTNYEKWAVKLEKELKDQEIENDLLFSYDIDTISKSTKDYLDGTQKYIMIVINKYEDTDYKSINFNSTFEKLTEITLKAKKDYEEILEIFKPSKKEFTVNKSLVKKYFTECISILKEYKYNIDLDLKYFGKAQDACKNGIKCSDDKKSEEVKKYKSFSSFLNQESSRYLNVYMKLVSVAVSFLKKYKANSSSK